LTTKDGKVILQVWITKDGKDCEILTPNILSGRKIHDIEFFKKMMEESFFARYAEFERIHKECSDHHQWVDEIRACFQEREFQKELHRPWYRCLPFLLIGETKAKRIANCSFSYANDPEFKRQTQEELDKAKKCLKKLQDMLLVNEILTQGQTLFRNEEQYFRFTARKQRKASMREDI